MPVTSKTTSTQGITIALSQQDYLVGDISGNLVKAQQAIEQALDQGADLILFPELAITGYPPEDLILRPGFMWRSGNALEQLVPTVSGIDVIMGHPWIEDGRTYNAVSWIRDGKVIGRYFKHCLPNYAVFDERRYFTPGNQPLVIDVKGVSVGVIICEDAWEEEPALMAKQAGAELLLVPNASPYRDDKLEAREEMFRLRHKQAGLPMVYCNIVGGQDELVFDGRSMLMSRDGHLSTPGPHCEDYLLACRYEANSGFLKPLDWPSSTTDEHPLIYQALIRGLRDYVTKNGFTDVVLGLSGGIDSALTIAVAVDALGAEHVHAVMMPSRHTSDLSLKLAKEQAEMLKVDYQVLSIEPAYEALLNTLEPSFEGKAADVTEENLQARCRANLLMALSNKFGWLLLSTGNKSELAVGYCTIYGDMCGGFAPIKDCFKTLVYELSDYRNRLSPAIPQAVIDRPPSAELAPDQTDQDSLPEYAVLDGILLRYVEQDWSIKRITEDGYDEAVVRRIAGLVLRNEHKRRQGAPGVRISGRAFGRDRRYPITSGWRDSG